MKQNMTFDKAYNELTLLVRQVESSEVPLDVLAVKIKEAKALVQFCEEKLRTIEADLQRE